jgi:hypothetical protein
MPRLRWRKVELDDAARASPPATSSLPADSGLERDHFGRDLVDADSILRLDAAVKTREGPVRKDGNLDLVGVAHMFT